MKEKLNATLDVISGFVDMVSNHGIWKIFKGLFVLCTCIVLVRSAIYLDPEKLLIELQNIETRQANSEREFRKESDVLIRNELKTMLIDTNADCVAILELHNGKSNSTGLGFYFVDMSMEITSGIPSTAEQFQNVNLSWLEMDDILYKAGYWYGDQDALLKADSLLHEKYSENGVQWVSFYLLERVDEYNITHEIGIVQISFNRIPTEEEMRKVSRVIRKHAPHIIDRLNYIK